MAYGVVGAIGCMGRRAGAVLGRPIKSRLAYTLRGSFPPSPPASVMVPLVLSIFA